MTGLGKIGILALLLAMSAGCMRARPSENVGCCDGRNWMRWSPAKQNAFMEGYIRGLMHGHNGGCEAAMEAARNQGVQALHQLDEACVAQNPASGVNFTDYRDKITEFYNRNPDSKMVPVTGVIDRILSNRSSLPKSIGTRN